jgi:MFS family permease
MPEHRRRPLFALLAADAVSLVGNVAALVAIPWFVLQETGRPALAGLVGFFTFLPTIVSAFLGGALVDRIGFRAASAISDTASAVAVAAIPVVHVAFGIEIWQLLALVFLGALLDAPGATARRSLLPDMAALGGMGLERASGIREAIQRGAVMVGAPLAGVLVAALGALNVLWLYAGGFLLSAALVLLFVPQPEPREAAEPTGYLRDLATGVRFLLGHRLIRVVVLTVLLTNFLDAPLGSVLMPVFAQEAFGSPVALGVVFGTFGAFALLGSLAFGAIGHRLPRRLTFVVSFFFASVPYLALSTLPSLPVTLVVAAAWGLAIGPINPILMTVAYERVPVALRGRVFGATTAGAYAAIPLGALLGGIVVEAIGIQATLLGIGLCYAAVTGYGLVNPVFREMDRRPGEELVGTAARSSS